MHDASDVTQMLVRWGEGDEEALSDLLPVLYDRLKQMAHARLRNERSDHTLGTTALVHEAYLRLVDIDRVDWQDRAHFLAIASTTMRRILVDYARRRTALRRGGDAIHYSLEDLQLSVTDNPEEVLMLSEVLDQLEALGEPFVQVVECRYFAGMTLEETAEALDISRRSVQRYWSRARLWLRKGLKESGAVEE